MRTYTLNLSTNSKTNPPIQNNGLNTQASWNINWREIFGNKTGECRVRAVLQTLCTALALPPSSIVFTTNSPTYTTIVINWTGGLSQDANPVTMSFQVNGTLTSPASVGTGTATFNGLTSNTTYTIIVTATTAGGYTSSTLIITTSAMLFPTTNLLYNFSALSGTSTTTNGASIATWTDARTGLVGSNAGTCAYNTSTTINSYPTTVGSVTTTLGTSSTVQNYWTWYCVMKTGSSLSGYNSLVICPDTNALGINFYAGSIAPSPRGIGWGSRPSTDSGGTVTWQFTTGTNYILTMICSSTNNTTSATQTYTYRINGVDHTPLGNTTSTFFYIFNPTVGDGSSTTEMYMGEQTLYNTNHTIATAQTMEQYLSKKWQIPIGSTPTIASSSPYSN